MKTHIRLGLALVVTVVLLACSSTLHLYSGQQYFPDEELGTLQVSEQIQIYTFNGKYVQKTVKPPVIKALPGKHRLELAVNLSEDEENAIERTVFWDAVEGRTYQLIVSETASEIDNVKIVDVTDN